MATNRVRISTRQREALTLVRDGRVTYGDLSPKTSARLAARHAGEVVPASLGHDEFVRSASPLQYAIIDFMVDGAEVYGQEKATYGSLSARGLIASEGHAEVVAVEEGPLRIVLTDAGCAALGAP